MPADLQSTAAAIIVMITFITICVRYAVKQRKAGSGTTCGGGCRCAKNVAPRIDARS